MSINFDAVNEINNLQFLLFSNKQNFLGLSFKKSIVNPDQNFIY